LAFKSAKSEALPGFVFFFQSDQHGDHVRDQAFEGAAAKDQRESARTCSKGEARAAAAKRHRRRFFDFDAKVGAVCALSRARSASWV
jgi:hypothetical protein